MNEAQPEDEKMSDLLDYLHDPAGCGHHWQPVSMVFETQLLDGDGRVMIRQPDLGAGRVFLVCLRCAQHTYMETSFTTYRLEGSLDRGFTYASNSTAPYSTDHGQTWRRERPEPAEGYHPNHPPERVPAPREGTDDG